jgi:predicted transposase YdaD
VYRDNLAVEAYAKEREQKFKEREQALKKAEAALKNTVRNLRQMGMDTEAIAKATGLTPEEVEKL